MSIDRPAKILLLCLSVLLTVSGCTSEKSEKDLLCYTSIPLEIMSDIKTDFELKYPDIGLVVPDLDSEPPDPNAEDVNLKVYREGSGQVIAKLAAEREAGGIKADILWIAEPSYYYTLKEYDELFSYQSVWLDKVPERFRDEDYTYWGARVFTMVIAYNPDKVETPPQNWAELTDPKWKDEIVIANPNYSGASLILVGALVEKFGWDYFTQLSENGMAVVKGNSVVAAKIASGEFSLGITIHNIVLDMKKSGSPIDQVYPDDGYVVIVSPVAIINNSDRKELAKTFLDYVLSEGGQRILVEKGNFIPVRNDVEGPPNTPPREKLLNNALDTSWLRDTEHVDLIKKTFQDEILFD